MDTKILKELGLSANEVRVYLALLSLGKTTTGPLVKKSGIPSSKIYSTLDSLVSKGIVGYVLEGKMKYFSANRPETLEHLLDLKEKELGTIKDELTKMLPSLNAEFAQERADYSVEVFEGLRGIKSVYDLALSNAKEGDVMYTLGYPQLASELLNAYFKEYHKKIAKKKLDIRIIYDYDTWFAKERESRPHAQQRILPKGIHTPGFMHITKEHVAIMVVTEKQKTAILIKNREVAQSYKQYFELIWNVSGKIEK